MNNYQNAARYEFATSQIANKMTNITDLALDGLRGTGRKNRWKGASGYVHQIDVSLENQSHVLLVECKLHTRPATVKDVLCLLSRQIDISGGQKSLSDSNINAADGREVRAALVVIGKIQRGVMTLASHYRRQISLFRVVMDDKHEIVEFETIMHTGFLGGAFIESGLQFGQGEMCQSNSLPHLTKGSK